MRKSRVTSFAGTGLLDHILGFQVFSLLSSAALTSRRQGKKFGLNTYYTKAMKQSALWQWKRPLRWWIKNLLRQKALFFCPRPIALLRGVWVSRLNYVPGSWP
ncbi:hypothetical protein HDV63DRAFT_64283 [Trichoderma sp. SZMC 28014]